MADRVNTHCLFLGPVTDSLLCAVPSSPWPGLYSITLAGCCLDTISNCWACLLRKYLVSSHQSTVTQEWGHWEHTAYYANVAKPTASRWAIQSTSSWWNINIISVWNIQISQQWQSIISTRDTRFSITTPASLPKTTSFLSSGRWLRLNSIQQYDQGG